VSSWNIERLDLAPPIAIMETNMASPALHSTLSIRTTRQRLELLVADLRPLFWRVLKTTPMEWFLQALPPNCDPLFFRKRLRELWTRLDAALSSNPQQSRYRVALDLLEVGLCITAVRAAKRTKGRSSSHSSIPNDEAGRRRRAELIRVLENLERRLRRRFEHECGDADAAAQFLQKLAEYRKIIVHEFFRPKRFTSGLKKMRRELFERLVTIACAGLEREGSEVPPEKELRKLISRWLKDVRRHRVAVGKVALYENPLVAEPHLLRFIRTRWARQNPALTAELDPSILQSQCGEAVSRFIHKVY